MPLRVKCRCGQELVLRYSEWVYLLLGMAFLAILLNSIVVVLLYVSLDDVASGLASRDGDREVALENAGDSGKSRGVREPPEKSELSPTPEFSPENGQRAVLEPSQVPHSGADASPEMDPRKPLEEVRLLRHSAGAEKTGQERPGTGEPGELSIASAQPTSTVPADTETLSSPSEFSWFPRSALLRLLVLEQADVADTLCLGFVLDPDLRIRRRAVDRLLTCPPGAFVGQEDAGVLIREAAPLLKSSEDGRRLLALLPAAAPLADGSRPAEENRSVRPILEALRKRAVAALAGEPSRMLEEYLDKAELSGVDVVLAVDVSQSMKGALEALQRDARWLLLMLSWALPEVRVGLVLYRDAVEATVDLSAAPGGDLLRLLLRSKAEGGGDVPEGVHEAVKVALSLGAMSWRESALKQIVLIGDAPPPFAELESLSTLLRQALQQGEYRLHAVSVGVERGRSEVPFFPRLAQAGGGRAVTVREAEVMGRGVFLLLFPEETHPLLQALAPGMRELVSSR